MCGCRCDGAYEESLALRRRLVDTYGETPQALRDLSVSLNSLGQVRRETGEVAGATAAYEESLALRRRLVDAYGETPQALRDLSAVSTVSARCGAKLERWPVRRQPMRSALPRPPCGRLRGDAPGAARPPRSVSTVSAMCRETGEVRCDAAHKESLALDRRLWTPTARRPRRCAKLSVSLDRLAMCSAKLER